MEYQYANHLSDYRNWDQLSHAEGWIVFPDNIGSHLCIDESSISQGELYTIITNRKAGCKKGAIVAMIKGTQSEEISKILEIIPEQKRNQVEEVSLDLAPTMYKIVRDSFPNAVQVIDRFHVSKLAIEAVQKLRIKHRWEAIEQENNEIELAKETNQKYKPMVLENGDTLKQLLARSRYLLFKSQEKWTYKQRERAELLFRYYPDIEHAYKLSRSLNRIYSTSKTKQGAMTKLAHWYKDVEEFNQKAFNTVAKTIKNNYKRITNFFITRNTNAEAEAFNAKIKSFRALLRGVNDKAFFFYRLSQIYA